MAVCVFTCSPTAESQIIAIGEHYAPVPITAVVPLLHSDLTKEI
jgi:hypothetical protein